MKQFAVFCLQFAAKKPLSYCLLPIAYCILLSSCQKQKPPVVDPDKPKRLAQEYFDKKYLLEKLPDDFYKNNEPQCSFNPSEVSNKYSSKEIEVEFLPLGYSPEYHLKYAQPYSSKCAHENRDSVWQFTFVGFPDRCLTQDSAWATVHIKNVSGKQQKYFFRVFWQNTSYWYTTGSTMNPADKNCLTNFYNGSLPVEIMIAANADTIIRIPYTIGRVRRHQYTWDGSKDHPRPGNYEFMLLWDKTKSPLIDAMADLYITNPFAEIQKRYRSEKKTPLAYVPASHFKFVFLEEFFDGRNDLNPNHYYYAKRHDEKPLCDTCSGWFKNIISEHWNAKEYFEGFISKARFVKADFGTRAENTIIDSNGITMKIPASKRGSYHKTWGEFLFVPAFKYGHVTVRAKFSRMCNYTGTPNGIIHNFWLFQRDRDPVDTSNPYHFVNYEGKQPYEIDFEIWNSEEGVNTMWDNQSFINYSVVDYMRNPNAKIKPGEEKTFGKYKVNRFNNRQINLPSPPLPANFFDSFHTYELYWYPDRIEFLLDRKKVGVITEDMASIPNNFMYLWVGSPIYQDGTYYSQSTIPFLKHEQQSIVDYIKIE